MCTNQTNYQYYLSAPGQLKTNVQSRLNYLNDVFGNLSELVQKFDSENRQMKEFITILLHFKYMLQFLKSNLIRDDELFKRLGPDAAILFKTDLKQCMAKFNSVIESSQCLEFVNEKNEYYQSNTTYCSYVEDDILCTKQQKKLRNELLPAKQDNNGFHHQINAHHSTENTSSVSSEKENSDNSQISQIKIEPEVEIIELAEPGDFSESLHSDDSRHDRFNQQHFSMHTLLEKSSSSGTNHKKKHKPQEERSGDLKLTIVNTPQCRKVLKRSGPSHDIPEEQSSSSKDVPGKKSKSSKANIFAFERQHSQDQDYDFDYEDEFDEDEYSSMNQCQIRCPQAGCMSIFDSEMELNEHINAAHFNLLELIPTYDCLVEGCREKFPNLARANVHMKNNHPDAYITCEQCQKQVKAHYLRKHVYMRHRKGEYKCSQDCDFVAEYYHELEKHRYMMHYNRYNWPDQGNGNGSMIVPSSSTSNNINVNSIHNNNNSEDIPLHSRFKRFACKWTDCSFSHESRSKVLKHIRIHHLGLCSRNGITQQPPNADDRKAFEYLDVIEYPDNSFYFGE